MGKKKAKHRRMEVPAQNISRKSVAKCNVRRLESTSRQWSKIAKKLRNKTHHDL